MLYEDLISKRSKLAVIGLGYVGMPLAVAFSKKISVIGFDLNKNKIKAYKNGIDVTKEVGDAEVKACDVCFTYDDKKLAEADFYIVAVPTPVRRDKSPDLSSMYSATRMIGQHLKKGAIVVYESTVYPGVTEEECIPILEEQSGLIAGKDFKVGYSPERINPSDKVHNLSNIVKIVSGMDEEALEEIARVYELVVFTGGVYRAPSIKVAEAAKVIENSQRDINIAFVNELSIIFHEMGIDTKEVLEAAGTKWNFLSFFPGLVGGHCIGVDPYYLTYKAESLGYHSQVILAGRRINDGMGKYVAENIVKGLICVDKNIKNAKVAILGFAFKENCQDTRNTKVIDIIKELHEYGIETVIVDDVADKIEAKKLYDIDIITLDELGRVDTIAVCVAHNMFRELKQEDFDEHFSGGRKMLYDIKGLYDRNVFCNAGYYYWRL